MLEVLSKWGLHQGKWWDIKMNWEELEDINSCYEQRWLQSFTITADNPKVFIKCFTEKKLNSNPMLIYDGTWICKF